MTTWTTFEAARKALPRMGAGLGYRGPLRRFFRACHQSHSARLSEAAADGVDVETVEWAPGEHIIRSVEVVAEHFFSRDPTIPKELEHVPLLVHCLDFSLGTPGALDATYTDKVIEVLTRLGGVVLSDHLAFTKTEEVELGHLNPIPPTRANQALVAGKIRELQERTGTPFLLENITTHLSLPGELRAVEFYRGVVEDADCGMLLDVTNIMVNCRNRKIDPLKFIDSLDLSRVIQLHLVGYSERAGVLYDSHVEDVTEDLFQLTEEVVRRAPVQSVMIERDGHWPHENVLRTELTRAQKILDDKMHRLEGQAA